MPIAGVITTSGSLEEREPPPGGEDYCYSTLVPVSELKSVGKIYGIERNQTPAPGGVSISGKVARQIPVPGTPCDP